MADPGRVITRLEPGRTLEFTWRIYGVPTTVTITLASDGAATGLTLHHGVSGDYPFGWTFFLGKLRDVFTGAIKAS